MTELSPTPYSNNVTLSASEEVKCEQEEIQEPNINLLRVKRVISTLSLTSVKVGDYLVIMKSESDLFLSGEPYIALMLLLDLKSGKCISRVWNQTVAIGSVSGENKLMEACKNLFCSGRPCVGYPVTETLFPRKHSSTCSRLLGTDVGADVTTCQECLKQSTHHSESDVSIKEDLDGDKYDNCALDRDIAEDDDNYNTVTSLTGSINMRDFIEESNKVKKRLNTNTEMKCPWCDEIFSSNCRGAFLDHQKKAHFWGKFKCPECTYEANFAQDLIEHIQKEEGHSKFVMVRCPYCRSDVPNADIISHYESCVTRFVQSKDGSAIPMGTENLNGSEEETCGLAFDKWNAMKLHQQKEHKPAQFGDKTCFLCKKTFKKTQYREHMKHDHFFGRFTCIKCGERAKKAQDLVEHIEEQDHTEDPFIVCPSCKDRVPFKEIQPHYEECVKKKRKERAKRWLQTERELNIKCPTCGKPFMSRGSLRSHMKIHMRKQGLSEDEEKTSLYCYCEECGAKLTRDSLSGHMRNFHTKGPFPCPDCSLEFVKWTAMNLHRRKEHKPALQCDLCDYKDSTPFGIENHKKKHFDPTFKCCYCGKMFKTKNTMEAHEREHRGEKPFPCPVCGSSFPSKAGLGQHARGVHGIAPKGGKTGWYNKKKKIDENKFT